MSNLGVGLLIVGSLILAVFLVTLEIRKRRLLFSFAQVAAHFRGQMQTSASPAATPSITFDHAGAKAVLDLSACRGLFRQRALRLCIAWPDSEVWCDVRPRVIRRTSIASGDDEFDKLYHARGAPREKVELLLSAAVRICINQLRFLYDSTNIHLRIEGGELTISKRGLSRNPTTIIRFAELALELYDQALLLHSAGLTFVTDSPAGASKTAVSDGAICRVCGEELHGAIVLCRNCRTPCHRDCWKYFGGCATYGCGGRKFHSGKAAARGA